MAGYTEIKVEVINHSSGLEVLPIRNSRGDTPLRMFKKDPKKARAIFGDSRPVEEEGPKGRRPNHSWNISDDLDISPEDWEYFKNYFFGGGVDPYK